MIKCSELKLKGVLLFEIDIFQDNRGSFSEVYNELSFSKYIPQDINFIQDNESFSNYGVLRGLHFQKPPFQQSKLIRVSHGEIQDVVVDLRKGSSTFGQYISIILSKKNKKQLFIPKGFAHGFLCLSKKCSVYYKCTNYRNANSEKTLLWNDKKLKINWGIKKPILSKKDRNGTPFKEIVKSI